MALARVVVLVLLLVSSVLAGLGLGARWRRANSVTDGILVALGNWFSFAFGLVKVVSSLISLLYMFKSAML
jgi:hypothetical protein